MIPNDHAYFFAVHIFSQFNEAISLSKQLSNNFDDIFSKFQFGFRRSFGTEHYFLLMPGTWKKAVDTKKGFGTLVTYSSKTIDCVYQEPIAISTAA